MTETPSQDQGSFLTGFTLGLFAGAAGYFLFATDNGRKLRDKVQEEWQLAQASLENSDALKKRASGIKEIVLDWVDSVVDGETQQKKTTTETDELGEQEKPARAAYGSKKSSKFKGV